MSAVNTRMTVSNMYGVLREKQIRYPWSSVLNHRLSPTLHRLKSLANSHHEKYKAYIALVTSMVDYAAERGINNLTVYLPSMRALRTIDIIRLVNDKESLQEITNRCYRPSAGKIDLRPLEGIDKLYRPAISFPTHML